MFYTFLSGMRKTKKYKGAESNMIKSGRHRGIQCDLYGQWHVSHIV